MLNRKIKVLQLTPHLGGGLGRVLINWVREERKLKTEVSYTLACLEPTRNATEDFSDLKDILYDDLYTNRDKLTELIKDSDIVVVNWYNHPLLFDILVNYTFPECRLVCYNHVSSLYPPYNMSSKLLKFFDEMIFTTNASFEAPEITNLNESLKSKCSTIESAFGAEYIEKPKTIKNDFQVGYVGTASYSKLDKNFVKLCTNVHISDNKIKFIVYTNDSQKHLIEDTEKLNMKNKIFFMGNTKNIFNHLKNFSVLGYPLQPKHFGTSEQAIGEAMVMGVVPVVMNNLAENYIIEHNKTGIIADSYEEYSKAIEYLYNNPHQLKRMSENAHTFAKYRYSLQRKIDSWEKIFIKVMNFSKKDRFWSRDRSYYDGREVFLESIGDYKDVFTSSEENIKELFKSNIQWYSPNKGGVRQYLKYFPDNEYLKKWEKLLD